MIGAATPICSARCGIGGGSSGWVTAWAERGGGPCLRCKNAASPTYRSATKRDRSLWIVLGSAAEVNSTACLPDEKRAVPASRTFRLESSTADSQPIRGCLINLAIRVTHSHRVRDIAASGHGTASVALEFGRTRPPSVNTQASVPFRRPIPSERRAGFGRRLRVSLLIVRPSPGRRPLMGRAEAVPRFPVVRKGTPCPTLLPGCPSRGPFALRTHPVVACRHHSDNCWNRAVNLGI